jgi:hypothetical protein
MDSLRAFASAQQLALALQAGMSDEGSALYERIWQALESGAHEARLPVSAQVRLFLRYPSIRPSHMLRLAEIVAERTGKDSPAVWSEYGLQNIGLLITHPSASQAVWLSLIERTGARGHVYWAAVMGAHAPARRDPEVGERLLQLVRGGQPDYAGVLDALVLSAPAEVFREAWTILAERDPARAAAALRKASRRRTALLTPDDLLPLLRSPDASVREAAVALLGKIAPPVPAERKGEPAARRSSRRAR